MITACISSAQSGLPPCASDYWTECYGEKIYSNGKYVGVFKYGKRNGYGTLNGKERQTGLWEDDEFVPFTVLPFMTPPITTYKSDTEMSRKDNAIDNERKKLEEERRQLAEERIKLVEEKRKLNTKPTVNNAQDIKRQRCINLGLLPNSADFQQCIK
jgi:hypothetical protein